MPAALALAADICAFPQTCLRHDRISALGQCDLAEADAVVNEFRHRLATIGSGWTQTGTERFAPGAGRHGAATD
jgi:enoyl-CoA hydratase